MARHLILLLSSDAERRDAWQRTTREAGHHALTAHTLARALFLLAKIRPSLVLADGMLEDGPVIHLLRHVRAVGPLARVIIVVLGDVTTEEQEHIAADARSHVRPGDAPIGPIVDEFVAAA